jgi:hypothetical protein
MGRCIAGDGERLANPRVVWQSAPEKKHKHRERRGRSTEDAKTSQEKRLQGCLIPNRKAEQH